MAFWKSRIERSVILAAVCCLLSLLFLIPVAHAILPSDAIPRDFWLGWDDPIRAYTGVPLQQRYTYYEKENRKITWSLSGAPIGMTIDQFGGVSWANPTAGTYPNIHTHMVRTFCNTVEYPACSLSIDRVFTLTVGTSDFVFVSPTGVDSGSCTLVSPCRTITYAATKVTGTDGKTIYVRGGNYNESFSELFAGQTFPITDYAEVRSYPGEWAAVNAVAGAGMQLRTTQYAVISNIEVKNSTAIELGNFLLDGTHGILKDAISHGARWDGNENVSGVLTNGNDIVVDRVASYDNHEVGGNRENTSNFKFYNDLSGGEKWVLNVKSFDTVKDVYVKHTNQPNSKTILHNFEFMAEGYEGFGNNSSVRYGVFYHATQCNRLGRTDPSAYEGGPMLVEHTTCIPNGTANDGFQVNGGFGEVTAIYNHKNIIYQVNGASGAAYDSRKFMQLWPFVLSSTARSHPFNSDCNIFYNPAGDTNAFIVGTTPPVNFATYKTFTGAGITRDPNSLLANPGFVNEPAGNLNLTVGSPANTICGAVDYAGAFKPGGSYASVGVMNTALLNFDGEGGTAPTPTPSPVITPTPTPTATPTGTPTATPTISPTPTAIPGYAQCSNSGFITQEFSKASRVSSKFTLSIVNQTTCQGYIGLAFNTSGLVISVRPELYGVPIFYTALGNTIEAIADVGTFVEPTANKIRISEVDPTSEPGVYEIQFSAAFLAVPDSTYIDICVTGAANIPAGTCFKVYLK